MAKLLIALCALLAPPQTAAAQGTIFSATASDATASDDILILLDEEDPVVTITSPLPGSVIAGSVITVTGTVSDPIDPEDPSASGPVFGEVQYRVGDTGYNIIEEGRVPLIDGTFSIPDVSLGSGLHYIQVIAVDGALNLGGISTSITSDPTIPAVSLVRPKDGEAFPFSEITLTLNFAEPTTLVSVSGEPDGRSFDPGLAKNVLVIPLDIGPNPVELEFATPTGTFVLPFTVFGVESIGDIRILEPTDGTLTNQPIVTVRGTVPRGTPFVEVNGVEASIRPDLATFTADVGLVERDNLLTARALPFNQEASVRVTLDTVPPVLKRIFPPDGTRLTADQFDLAGIASESARVRIVGPVDEASTETDATVIFAGDPVLGLDPIIEHVFDVAGLALADGLNSIAVLLTDLAGNQTQTLVEIERALEALVLVDPADGSSLPGARADIRLEAVADLTIEAVYSGSRKLESFLEIPVFVGSGGPAEVLLPDVPLAPGISEYRVVYRRDGAAVPDVLSFELESSFADFALVSGQVTSAQTGEAIGGAIVTVTVNGISYLVATDPDGSYLLSIEPGAVAVRVVQEGYVNATVSGQVLASQTFVADAALVSWSSTAGTVEPGSGGGGLTDSIFSGVIRDASTGAPLPGALIDVTVAGATQSGVTDAFGSYVVTGVPNGSAQISIAKEGFFTERYVQDIESPATFSLNADLEVVPTTFTLVGSVTNPVTGLPEAGVRAAVVGSSNDATTDAEGIFVLEDIPLGEHAIRLKKEGFREGFFLSEIVAPPAAGLPIKQAFLYPTDEGNISQFILPLAASGRVVDALTRKPLANTEVSAGSATATTDADGRFTFEELEPGFYEFSATTASYSEQSQGAMVLPNGRDLLIFELFSQTTASASGLVTDAVSGEPIPGAEVRIVGSDRLGALVKANGESEITDVTPGTHSIAVIHPEYHPQRVDGLSFVAETATEFSASLVPKAKVGDVEGRVLDEDSGDPVAGAVVMAPNGVTSTTNALGEYSLVNIPTGAVSLDVTASGYPNQVRSVWVMAHISAEAPSTMLHDLTISKFHPAEHEEATVRATVTEGGSVTLPSGRFHMRIPPFSLTGDADVTIRLSLNPVADLGDLLEIDPALGAGQIAAAGAEVEILIEPLGEEGPAPKLFGPIVISQAYAEVATQIGSANEDTLIPYVLDGAVWTAPRLVPYARMVDRMNRVVISAIVPSWSETGQPIVAGVATREPILLAQADCLNLDLPVFEYLYDTVEKNASSENILSLLREKLSDRIVVHLGVLVDQHDTSETAPAAVNFLDLVAADKWKGTEEGSGRPIINKNGQPLIVVPGWSPENLWRNTPPEEDLAAYLADGSNRFTWVIEDLVNATHGVYRPIFVSYNSRARLELNAKELSTALNHALKVGEIRGVLPPGSTSNDDARFDDLNSFGFSMGGLFARTFQSVNYDKFPITRGVSLATPHHGALERLMNLFMDVAEGMAMRGLGKLKEADFVKRIDGLSEFLDIIEFPRPLNPGLLLLRIWSPGTAQLMNYEDVEPDLLDKFLETSEEEVQELAALLGFDEDVSYDIFDTELLGYLTANPFLWSLNRQLMSSPTVSQSFVAGNDSLTIMDLESDMSDWLSFLAATNCVDPEDLDEFAENILSLGFLLNGEANTDGIVPVSSAQALRKDGDTVAAFKGREVQQDQVVMFDHLSVGFDAQAHARGLRISEFMDVGIIPWFDDHVVEYVDKNEHSFSLPTETEDGFVHDVYVVDFNVNRGDLSGVLAVTYGSFEGDDGVKHWRVLHGARLDNETGRLIPDLTDENSGFKRILGNSRNPAVGTKILSIEFAIPKVAPSRPETKIDGLVTLIKEFGPNKQLVIEPSPGGGFGVP